MSFETAKPKFFVTVAKLMALGALGAGAYCVADRINSSDRPIFNPDKPVEVVERYHDSPDDWRLELEQCGFSLISPEADERGCHQEQRDVTRRQYQAYPVGSRLYERDL